MPELLQEPDSSCIELSLGESAAADSHSEPPGMSDEEMQSSLRREARVRAIMEVAGLTATQLTARRNAT